MRSDDGGNGRNARSRRSGRGAGLDRGAHRRGDRRGRGRRAARGRLGRRRRACGARRIGGAAGRARGVAAPDADWSRPSRSRSATGCPRRCCGPRSSSARAACCSFRFARATRSSGRWSCSAAGASSTGVSARWRWRLRTRSRWLGGLSATGAGRPPLRPTCSALPATRSAAGSDEARAADQVATLAAEATGASACVVWRYEQQGPVLAALSGTTLPAAVALEAVGRARDVPGSLAVESLEEGGAVVTLQLGEPPQGALQLLLAEEPHPSDPLLDRLGIFAVRAAHALRAGERRQTLSVELERARALLTIVGQAISQLSLAHTLDTAIEHVSGLLEAKRVAVYLSSEPGRLEPAAERELTGPHARVAERLLELLLGPSRGARPALHPVRGERPTPERRARRARGAGARGRDRGPAARPGRRDRPARGLPRARPGADRERGTAPARARGPARGRRPERAAARAGEELADESSKVALDAEREARGACARSTRSRASFAQSLSLDATLEAVARTIVETLEVDAAVDPHARRARARFSSQRRCTCAEARLAEPLSAILSRAPAALAGAADVFRSGRAILLDPRSAACARRRRTSCSCRSSRRARRRRSSRSRRRPRSSRR